MDYFAPLPNTSPTFSKSTLLLPQPSLGSLPQLAADLLIHTLKLQLVGYLAVRDTVPAVSGLDGLEGEEREGISMGVEVYQTTSKDLTVVLPRSPIIRARKPHHLVAMKRWIAAAEFGEVLLLAGVDAATRLDEGLREATPLRQFTFPSAATPTPLQARLTSLAPSFVPSSSSSAERAKHIPLIPHGGRTRQLLETLSPTAEGDASLPPTSALLIYAAEGDNSASAFLLADALAKVLELEVTEANAPANQEEEGHMGDGRLGLRRGDWRKPKSWQTGLMGEELGRERGGEMYG